MKFAWPWFLAAAALLPVLLVLFHWWSERRALRRLDAVIAPRLRSLLLRSVDFARRWHKVFVFAFALAALFVALARPQLGENPVEVERSSVDILIGLDLSRSMLAEDVEGKSRLVAAREGIEKFLDELGNDRAGLVAFAGDAFLSAPVTQDHESVKRNLAALDPSSIAKQGSDLAKAIQLAEKTFEKGKYDTKALVLVTDGEQLQGDAMIAARAAAQKGMAIFTVGVGSAAGARIPDRQPGGLAKFARNEFGNEVITRLNERMLQQLAASGRGLYEPLGADGAGLLSIWHQGLEPLAKGVQSKQSKDPREYFQWPLGVAVLLLLAEMLVTDRKKRVKDPERMKATVAPVAVAALVALSTTSAHAAYEQERAALAADPAKVAVELEAQLAQRPNDPWLKYNAGVAAYAAHDYAKADELWEQLAATALPDSLREQVWLQIGNVSYRLVQGQIEKEPDQAVPRLEQSRESFRVSLSANKRNQTAAKNLAVVEKELEKIYARLAQRLAEEGKKESWAPKAIEKLEAALTYARQAEALSQKDPQRQQERQDIEKALGQKYDQRAGDEEKTADQRGEQNAWERQDAQEHLENALADFQQAQSLNTQDQTAKEGEQRVKDKLANLLDRTARQEQKQGEDLAKYAPQEAADQFEKALDHFEQALATQPEHADAKAGEQEVRKELEQLHLDQGDREAQRGEQEAKQNPQDAAQELTSALEHFEAAKTLDPQNAEIQPRIDKVQAMLPELLTQLGQQEQKQGERAEQQQDLPSAVEDFQQAESDFARAQEMQPGNKAAEQGEKEAQAALARLQQQMAQQQQPGQPQPGQPQNAQQQKQAQQAFDSMLARVKEDEKDRDVQSRHHRGQKYVEERNKNLRNW